MVGYFSFWERIDLAGSCMLLWQNAFNMYQYLVFQSGDSPKPISSLKWTPIPSLNGIEVFYCFRHQWSGVLWKLKSTVPWSPISLFGGQRVLVLTNVMTTIFPDHATSFSSCKVLRPRILSTTHKLCTTFYWNTSQFTSEVDMVRLHIWVKSVHFSNKHHHEAALWKLLSNLQRDKFNNQDSHFWSLEVLTSPLRNGWKGWHFNITTGKTVTGLKKDGPFSLGSCGLRGWSLQFWNQ